MYRLLSVLCLLFIAIVPAAQAEESILYYHTTIQIEASGDLIVTELIRVRAEGREIKRGIYRTFPTRYRGSYGQRVNVGFEVLSVKRDGRVEPYHMRTRPNGKAVYIGQKNYILPTGVYDYELKYRTTFQIGFFEEHDELYFNAIPHDFAFPIAQAEVTVLLPPGVSAEQTTYDAYTGKMGARSRWFALDYAGGNMIRFKSTRAFLPKEGMTIVVGFPKGFVEEPTFGDRTQRLLRDNWQALVASYGLLIVAGYFYWAWLRVGVDPKRGTVIPRFEPPEEMSPYEVRYIWKRGFDNNCLAAAVLSMAIKGFLRIKQKDGLLGFGNRFSLHSDGGHLETLQEEEKRAAAKLLGSGVLAGRPGALVLENEEHKRIKNAKEELEGSLEEKHLRKTFFLNRKFWYPGVVLSAVFCGILAIGRAEPEQIFSLVFVSAIGFPIGLSVFRAAGSGSAVKRVKIFVLLFALLPFIIAMSSIAGSGLVNFPLLPLGICATFVGLNVFFFHLLEAPTKRGQLLLDYIEGYRMYLKTAEEDRLQNVNLPQITPERYESHLPYAFALDCDQEWSRAFEKALITSGKSLNTYQPQWHSGGSYWHQGSVFDGSFGSSFASAIASSSTPPGSSSGGGGGGFSGGGGGGGGGGGW